MYVCSMYVDLAVGELENMYVCMCICLYVCSMYVYLAVGELKNMYVCMYVVCMCTWPLGSRKICLCVYMYVRMYTCPLQSSKTLACIHTPF